MSYRTVISIAAAAILGIACVSTDALAYRGGGCVGGVHAGGARVCNRRGRTSQCVVNWIRKWSEVMKILLSTFVLLAAFFAVNASAQGANLTGQYLCIQGCAPGFAGLPAFITQDGWDLNLRNEAGEPSRAWIDWPGHLWAQYWNEGAVISPDGMVVQFDRGQVWQRYFGPPPPPAFRN